MGIFITKIISSLTLPFPPFIHRTVTPVANPLPPCSCFLLLSYSYTLFIPYLYLIYTII